jgi:uncharacterized protein
MQCRSGCAACCIAPSISTAMPKHPLGKAAGVACAHLTTDYLCELFGQTDRPAVCGSLQPSVSMCGNNQEQALTYLIELESLTAPA